MKNKYYPWNKTLSYDADITMVVTSRGFGKTYGLRKQFINDYLRKGWRFVEVTRYREEMSPLMSNYFDRLQREFKHYTFKTENNMAWVAKKTSDKPKWELCGYFVAMTQFQMIKKLTFNNVKRILLDECVLEKDDTHHRYLRNEWNILTNIVDTVTRERADDTIKPKLYLLGNACDPLNPYFEHAGLSGVPERGYSWHCNKTFLLHYADTPEYSAEKKQTLAGRMATGNAESVSVNNSFVTPNDVLIGDKTSVAKYVYALEYAGSTLAIWVDERTGTYFVNDRTPNNAPNMFSLTLDDKPNYPILKRTNPLCKQLIDAYRLRYLKFDKLATCGHFEDMLRYCGFR